MKVVNDVSCLLTHTRPRTTTLLPQGIYVGDVTNRSSLLAAMTGVDSVACAVGVSAVTNDTLVKNVEWLGVENQVRDGWARSEDVEWLGCTSVCSYRCCSSLLSLLSQVAAFAMANSNVDVGSLYFALVSCECSFTVQLRRRPTQYHGIQC
jgi:hypothetical protein